MQGCEGGGNDERKEKENEKEKLNIWEVDEAGENKEQQQMEEQVDRWEERGQVCDGGG